MFQQEFRELTSLLVNVLLAVVVLSSIVFTLTLKNKVGVIVSEGYTTEQTMQMYYEFNLYDGTTLTADECIAAYSQYINSDVELCVVKLKPNFKQGAANAKFKDYELIDVLKTSDIESVISRNVDDYRVNSKYYTTEYIKLGTKTGYVFDQDKKYKIYLAYDEEDPKLAMNKYSPTYTGASYRPSYVSGLVFVEME